MRIFCCACLIEVEARLTNGAEIYPHRSTEPLADLPFWICDTCGNYVGCHHKTEDRTRPLGCIADAPMRNARKHIHALIDPAWQSGRVKRGKLYEYISAKVGWKFHTADLRTIEDARTVYKAARDYILSISKKSS